MNVFKSRVLHVTLGDKQQELSVIRLMPIGMDTGGTRHKNSAGGGLDNTLVNSMKTRRRM